MSELFVVYSSTKFDDGEEYTTVLETARTSRKAADEDVALIKVVTGRNAWVETRVSDF